MIAFRTAGAAASGAGVTELIATVPAGAVSGDLLLIAYGFEGVAAGSGPWVDENTGQYSTTYIGSFTDWKRLCYQGPSAAGGSGLEIWAALFGSGSAIGAKFIAAMNVVAVTACWAGAYDASGHIATDGTVRAATTAQVTGNNPAAPSVFAFENEMLIAAAADTLTSPGYGTPTPSGWTKRTDAARGGVYGNVEVALADKLITVEGDTGAIPFPATASPAGAKGATATLAARPAPPAASSPLIAVEFAVAN